MILTLDGGREEEGSLFLKALILFLISVGDVDRVIADTYLFHDYFFAFLNSYLALVCSPLNSIRSSVVGFHSAFLLLLRTREQVVFHQGVGAALIRVYFRKDVFSLTVVSEDVRILVSAH